MHLPSAPRPRLASLLVLLALGALACERKAPPPASAPEAPTQAQAPVEQQTLLIGSVGGLTGPEAPFGGPVLDGIRFAVEKVNAAGGVKGHKVEVRGYDSQGRLEGSVSAAQRLINKDRVLLIIGDISSSGSLAIADVAQAAHVPMVTPSATHPDVTRKGDYIFRTCFVDAFQGQVMARFAREQLKLERISILQDGRNEYSIGLGEAFAKAFTQLGGTIASVEGYSKGDTDLRSALLTVKQAKPQALYIPGTYSEVGLLARQAHEVGLKVPMLGGDGWDSDRLLELAGDTMEGSYYSTHYAQDNPSPEQRRFATEYQASRGHPPDVSVVVGYEAAVVALAAMARAESLTGPAIRDALAKTKEIPVISGTLTLDAERNPVKPAVILKIQGGKRVFAAAATP